MLVRALLPVVFVVITGCTTLKMWRENDNFMTNVMMTPVKLVEDVVTLGGSATPEQGMQFWMTALSAFSGSPMPPMHMTMMHEAARQEQLRQQQMQQDPDYHIRRSHLQRPQQPLNGDYHYDDVNRTLNRHPTAAGPYHQRHQLHRIDRD